MKGIKSRVQNQCERAFKHVPVQIKLGNDRMECEKNEKAVEGTKSSETTKLNCIETSKSIEE